MWLKKSKKNTAKCQMLTHTPKKKPASSLPSRQGRQQEAANAQTSSTAPCSTLHNTLTAPCTLHRALSQHPAEHLAQHPAHPAQHPTHHPAQHPGQTSPPHESITLARLLHRTAYTAETGSTLQSTFARPRHRSLDSSRPSSLTAYTDPAQHPAKHLCQTSPPQSGQQPPKQPAQHPA